MRILFVAEQFEPDIGGLATSGTRIAKTLAEAGHEVDVFLLTRELDSGIAETEERSVNLRVHRFGSSKQQDFSLQQAMIFLEWLNSERRFDLVWSHYAMNSGFAGIWFANLNQIRSVVSVRGNDLDRQLFPPGDFSRLNWMLQNATTVVSVSHDLAAKIKTLSGVEAKVLHNSVDSKLFSPGEPDTELQKKYQLNPEELVLVFCGELRAKKGLPMLIDCFRRTARKRPARLLIVGDVREKDRGRFEQETEGITKTIFGDDEAERFAMPPAVIEDGTNETLAERPSDVSGQAERNDNANPNDNVGAIVVTGHQADQSDVVRHLRLGNVFLLPSLWDGLPNSLLEAMATGIPVVASDAGAIGEVLTDGETGVIISRSHLHQMAEQVEKLLARPEMERQRMTVAAREFVVANHSRDAERRQLEELVQSFG